MRFKLLLFLCVLLSAEWLSAGDISLAWDAVVINFGGGALTDTPIRYNVRWGTTSGQHTTGTITTNTTITVKGLDPNQVYYFVVTCENAANKESSTSNEVSARPTLLLHQ